MTTLVPQIRSLGAAGKPASSWKGSAGALGNQAVEHGHNGVGVDAAVHGDRQGLAGVLVDHVCPLALPTRRR